MSRTTRREFFQHALLGGEAIAPVRAERTLVCVFLRGAADTLNMVIPYGDDQYYKLRPTLSIKAPSPDLATNDAAIRLDDFYAVHPKLRPLVPIFKEGRLGIVQAVGTDNPTGSHFEAQDQMEHGEAYGRTIGGGWLGRYMRTRTGTQQTPLSAVAIGPTIPESLRGAPSASSMKTLDEVQIKMSSGDPQAVSAAMSEMYGAEVGVLSQPGKTTLDLLKRVEKLRGVEYKPDGNAVYAEDDFAQGLKEVARMVKANVGLEIVCLDLGGWDTHFFQGGASGQQAELMNQLALGLAAFDTDLAGMRERVTTLVMTEFGRRVYENGSLGTDHGRGFALMAMGHGIAGGKVHGKWPGLSEDDIPGPGGLTVQYDYRSVLSEVLAGVLGHRNLDKVFPDFDPVRVGLAEQATGA